MKMKKLNILLLLCAGITGITSCSDFDEVNIDPKAAQADQTQAYYALNKSIGDAQQGPHEAERIFVYNWKSAARYHQMGHLVTGSYADDYMDDYHNSKISNWMKSATLAMNLADAQIESGKVIGRNAIFVNNVKQVARIWYVYLTSEYVDNFGIAPINMVIGEVPTFSSSKDVYYFMLDELKDATSKIDVSIELEEAEKKGDPAYEFDFNKWIKYANSMRLRLAMRLSEVDPAKAQSEFEEASKLALISNPTEIFKVKEKNGWDNLSGVMSRTWNQQCLSSTMSNLMTNLGGVKTTAQLTDARYASYIKDNEKYLGVYYPQHFSEYTDNPTKQFWMDGIPSSVDPRAFKLFFLPQDKKASNFSDYCADGNYEVRGKENIRGLVSLTNEKDTLAFVNPSFSWNGMPNGYGGPKYSRNQIMSTKFWGSYPSLGTQYRKSENSRIFFGDWEVWFLLAEGAVRGWNVGVNAETAYENGIMASFVYNECVAFYGDYIKSESYSRVGTSVSFNHTAEPPVSVEMDYVDGYTKKAGKYTYHYPVASKTLYGKAMNDKLSKIITQKYLAQMPYLPLEAWSDFRRLGLPFFEIPNAEEPLPYMPEWNVNSYKNGQKVSLYPQRLKFPASLQNADPAGYAEALKLLGGADNTLTPIWWAKH